MLFELANEGIEVKIPANVVDAPDQMASLIYMFNIHQFREQWELMPTALALKSVIEQVGSDDTDELTELTGLSDRQVERCKIILRSRHATRICPWRVTRGRGSPPISGLNCRPFLILQLSYFPISWLRRDETASSTSWSTSTDENGLEVWFIFVGFWKLTTFTKGTKTMLQQSGIGFVTNS